MSNDAKAAATSTLGDESFMSAKDLRVYMTEMQMAHASSEIQAMDNADKARKELVKTMSEPLEVTPEVIANIKKRLGSSIKAAAARGETQIMVMRFPNVVCTDRGRAINNAEEGWPDTLTGRPRQAYELWRDHLRGQDYKLTALIIDWPGGLPGDIGFFLNW